MLPHVRAKQATAAVGAMGVGTDGGGITEPSHRRSGPTVAPAWCRAAATTAAGAFVWTQLSLITAALTLGLLIGPRLPIVVEGSSMTPRIRVGDLLVVDRPGPSVELMGRVVVFDHGDGTVAHRIVGEPAPSRFTTRGDANTTVDSTPLRRAAVDGRGRFVVPYVGLPGHWVRNGDWAQLIAWMALVLGCAALTFRRRPAPAVTL